ncbi:competence/damage-inducible protein A [Salibacterium halotolerans]|uniref:Putative competence-damage inducible protein n=1 Tax=Salibacterium halotolerans TaxID=1884432 RepID=A0A1I5Y5P6_9BACI|nr:competence/damage-inducible protein A [Salibacterium halotolerans]SFQ39518.1 nicotinamide-nucleotide amidase [Salibacterium halotolerans]
MNAEIIAVGSELLLGQIANTNGRYLSGELAGIGINVYRHTVVGDNETRLLEAFREAAGRADVVVVTGGLGPTQDDLTKDMLARLTERPLVLHEPTMEKMKYYFDGKEKPMPQNNKKQALYTEGSDVFYNEAGFACGVAQTWERSLFLLLPGPPRELKHMFEHSMKPYLLNRMDEHAVVHSRVLRFFGIGESSLEEQLSDLIEQQTNPTIAPLASDGEVTVRLTAKAPNRQQAENMLDTVEKDITRTAGPYLYGRDQETLPSRVVKELTGSRDTIASAESITGGWFSKVLVDVPGASAVLEGSATVYTEKAKRNVLGVERPLLEEFGAVSRECAEDMAEKVRLLYGTTIGISFTGSAGPESLEGEEPGTVWIGISVNGTTNSHRLQLSGSREHIRRMAVYYGCWYVLNR